MNEITEVPEQLSTGVPESRSAEGERLQQIVRLTREGWRHFLGVQELNPDAELCEAIQSLMRISARLEREAGVALIDVPAADVADYAKSAFYLSPEEQAALRASASPRETSCPRCAALLAQNAVAQEAGFGTGWRAACDAFAAKTSFMCSTSRSAMRDTDCICDIVTASVDAVRAALCNQKSKIENRKCEEAAHD